MSNRISIFGRKGLPRTVITMGYIEAIAGGFLFGLGFFLAGTLLLLAALAMIALGTFKEVEDEG